MNIFSIHYQAINSLYRARCKKLIRLFLTLTFIIIAVQSIAQADDLFEDKDIIDIIGLNYGRLQLTIEIEDQASTAPRQMKQMISMLTRNLMWSGMFDIRESMEESDLRLKIRYKPKKEIRAWIFSQEGMQLFDEFVNLSQDVPFESALLEIVEAIIYQLTGEKSIFRSAIAYVRKDTTSINQKGGIRRYELVMTDTFGSQTKLLLYDGELNILPRWNPDGRSILFTSLGSRGSQLKNLDITSGKVRTLFSEMGKLSGGTWGKNGKELIITLVKRGNADLFRIDLRGQILEKMTTRTSSESNPRWSPDNSSLLFVSNRSGNVQIYQRDLLYKETFRMTFEGTYNVEPCWSNDGANIVFSGIKDKVFHLFLMDKDGQYVQQLTHGKQSSEQPIWSPNGRQILFVSKVGFDQKLFLIRADGTFKRRLTKSGPGISEFNPTWLPDFKWPKDHIKTTTLKK